MLKLGNVMYSDDRERLPKFQVIYFIEKEIGVRQHDFMNCW